MYMFLCTFTTRTGSSHRPDVAKQSQHVHVSLLFFICCRKGKTGYSGKLERHIVPVRLELYLETLPPLEPKLEKASRTNAAPLREKLEPRRCEPEQCWLVSSFPFFIFHMHYI